MSFELTFLGAAGTVTGSRFLLHVNGRHYWDWVITLPHLGMTFSLA